MQRAISHFLQADLPQKMVLVTGPRQVGKTTLARDLGKAFGNPLYLNYDAQADKERIRKADWPRSHDYVVLDELHSMPDWKNHLKGVFDTKPAGQALLVTGSARLDTFRQAGESLAGRYHHWRLLPLSVRELAGAGTSPQPLESDLTYKDSDIVLDNLMRFGGFPEPLFKGTDTGRKRWQNQYFTDMVREDVLEFSRIHELRAMRDLLALLRTRTGRPLSFESLARDLALSPKTVRSYVDILEALHIVFLIHPYHRNIARAQAKAPKLYFYDWAYVQSATPGADELEGAQFENLVAVHLLKHCCFLADAQGEEINLHYVRTTSGKEIDFVLANEHGDATHFIEVKNRDNKPSLALRQMAALHPQAQTLQLVRHARHGFDGSDSVQVRPAAAWLAQLAA